MPTFQTPQYSVSELLARAADGRLQLPDFQRPYRWDDERIRSLLVTVLRGHPMGVIMTLETGGKDVRFKPRPLTGVDPDLGEVEPELLLLDGQQRMTSMFQALTGDGVVDTEDERHHKLSRRYFIDVEKALGDTRDQDDAIVSLPGDGILRENFNRDVVLDVSTPESQQAEGLMPLNTLLDKDAATNWIWDYTDISEQNRVIGRKFSSEIMQPMQGYQIPAIQLAKDIGKDAVATVFEKVNTGGLPLDTFELLTATFAGDRSYFEETGEDFRLGEDWACTQKIIDEHPALHGLRATDILMAVSVLVTLEKRRRKESEGVTGKRLPQTSARREDILGLDLADYRRFAPKVRTALPAVARHLRALHIHTERDVPYRSQLISLTVFHVLLGERADEHAVRSRLNQWYWCGVLGELYGSTIETKVSRDAEQVPRWALGESTDVPDTVARATFAESRLSSLRTRQSAAYKGIYALLMSQEGKPLKDWMLDRELDQRSYDELQVDIHHVFPKQWCISNDIDPARRESIINKTPLSQSTNIKLKGDSPAIYMHRLDAKGLTPEQVDAQIATHAIDPAFLRAGDFDGYCVDRRHRLVALIEAAMGKAVARDWDVDSEETDQPENFTEAVGTDDETDPVL